MFRNALAAGLAGCVLALALAPSEAQANPTLTYDSNTIVLTPGGTATVTATLSLSAGDAPIVTDSQGHFLPPFLSLGGPSIAWPVPEDASGPIINGVEPPPDYIFYHSVSVTRGPASQLANLDLLPGDTLSLTFGTITADPSLPVGTYTIDVGLEYCPPGPLPSCNLIQELFGPPNYADAGPLTIEVVAVPEPATVLLLAPALVTWFGASRRWAPANRQGRGRSARRD